MATTYYEPLYKTINILAVDDSPEQLDFYTQFIAEHPLFSIVTANTAKSAEKIIHSGAPISMGILDCGINDINKDEFYLLKRYHHKFPIIIISGASDMERGYEACRIGAAGLLSKPLDVINNAFWDKFSKIFLDRKILPHLPDSSNPVIKECCRVLQDKFPETVAEWAAHVRVTESYLRRLWTESFSVPPKHVLFIYRLYKNALDYCNSEYLSGFLDSINLPKVDNEEYRRTISYYQENQTTFSKMVI